jgi:hypothetical protein
MFMTYFIHKFLTNMFRPILQPSSELCYYYRNTKIQTRTFVFLYSCNNITLTMAAVAAIIRVMLLQEYKATCLYLCIPVIIT